MSETEHILEQDVDVDALSPIEAEQYTDYVFDALEREIESFGF